MSDGFEGKLTLGLNTLQAFIDAITEGGPRRCHGAEVANRPWWSVDWASGAAMRWAEGHAVTKSTVPE